jgi:hypothetical protein
MEIGTSDTRDRVPTPDGWVMLPGGGIVPAKLDRPTGWGDDRDTINVTRITTAREAVVRAVKNYDDAVKAILAAPSPTPESLVAALVKGNAVSDAWHKFTEATGDAS